MKKLDPDKCGHSKVVKIVPNEGDVWWRCTRCWSEFMPTGRIR